MSLQADLFGPEELYTEPDHAFHEFNAEYVDYTLVDTEEKLQTLVKFLERCDRFAFDTETTGLDPYEDDLLGISLSTDQGVAWYAPTKNSSLSKSKIMDALRPFFESNEFAKIAHNYKFDHKVLHWNGIEVDGTVFDTMVAGYLIDHDQKLKMDFLSKKYLDYKPIDIDSLFATNKTLETVPVQQVSIYACEDADITYRLFEHLNQKLKDEGMTQLAYEVELPITQILARMEVNGVKINKEFMYSYLDELQEMIEESRTKMFDMAGHEFNPNSYQQVGEVMYDEIGLPVIEKTDSGNRATGEDVLNKLKDRHDLPKELLEYRKISKLHGTYVKPIPEKVNDHTGRLHTRFKQTRTATGRLSSAEPNLQNIPIRTELGRKVRKAFVAPEGKYLMSADYSQMELRIIASICQDSNMLEIFREGKDIHSGTASEIYDVDIEDVTEDQRYQAKTINYALPYGADYPKIARELEISENKAKVLLDSYFRKFPKMKEYINQQHAFVEEHGYVETRFGRRRYLPEINSSNQWKRFSAQRQAVNMPIQGESADIMKLAMQNVAQWINSMDYDVKMLLQIHDEILFEIPRENSDIVSGRIVPLMENAYDIGVPLTVDHGISKTWFEGH